MKKQVVAFLKENIGLNSQVDGFGGWLNGKLLSISDEGEIVLEFEVREEMLNPMGTIHGGALSAILDEAMGMQLFIKSSDDDVYFALNISVDFVKNAKFGEKLRVETEVVRIGKNTANLRSVVFNAKSETVAHGSSNFLKVKG
jgi:uncharacterized protein (TIGR00369 family)